MENERKHPTNDLMATTMQKLREMVDVNTVMGTPIQAEGVTLIPVSTVSIGFASGGSDFTTKNRQPEAGNAFGGGSGAGVRITPIGFLVVRGDNVKLLPVAPPAGTTMDRVVEMVPDLVDKVTEFIEKQQVKKKEAKEAEAAREAEAFED